MTIFLSSLLTTYSQISILSLGAIILIALVLLVKRTLIEGEKALTEIRNNKK